MHVYLIYVCWVVPNHMISKQTASQTLYIFEKCSEAEKLHIKSEQGSDCRGVKLLWVLLWYGRVSWSQHYLTFWPRWFLIVVGGPTHRRIFSSINGLYLWDASSHSPPHYDTKNVSRCCLISSGVGLGDKITLAWEPFTIREPLVIKVSSILFFFFFSFCGLSVCAQSMEIKAYCALELNNSFFLARVVWDKLPNFWVSIPLSVWDVEVKHTLAGP